MARVAYRTACDDAESSRKASRMMIPSITGDTTSQVIADAARSWTNLHR